MVSFWLCATYQNLQSKDAIEKALLLLNNIPSHTDKKKMISGEIKAASFSWNVVTVSEPMNHNVLKQSKTVHGLFSEMLSNENNMRIC